MADDAELARAAALRNSLPRFAAECLKIRDTAGNLDPLELNPIQRYVHERLEAQLAERGWVRAIVLKSRRAGVSTYVAARYYHKASTRKGRNVYILAHKQDASDTLFGIVDRYQRHNPLAPHIGVSNAKELVFDKLDSSYAVATAGTVGGGRSKTIQLFHGSEVGFWMNASDHFKSSVQTVSLVPGTEIILESTANGVTGEFYERWKKAEIGEGDYIAIFVPWFMDPANVRAPDAGFELSTEGTEDTMSEAEYAAHHGLTLAQMAWRRGKIQELGSDSAFQQEYPGTAQEAFVDHDNKDPFIKSILVMRAAKRRRDPAGPLILGVDPASMGGDRFSIAARRGLCIPWVRHRNKLDTLEGTAWVRSLIDELSPARVNIDAGNIGAAIITNLKSLGPKYVEIVRAVNFGGTSQAKLARPKAPGPKNRRAEMWLRSREWLQLPEGVSIPDDSALLSDAAGPRNKPTLTNDTMLESKQDMKARGVRSPDLWDAVALTFASDEYFENYVEERRVTPFGDLDTPRAAGVVQRHFDLETGLGGGGWMI